MALLQPIQTQYGVELNYWKVSITNVDWHNKRLELALAGYYDQASRINGKMPLEFVTFYFENDDFFPDINLNLIQQCYQRLQSPVVDYNGNDINPFQAATEIFEPGQPVERP
jgi:hypothetical protein